MHSYKYRVEYKKEKENVAADSLSRKAYVEESTVLMITSLESDWLGQLRTMVDTEGFFVELNSKWEDGKLDPSKYQKKGGLFYYKNRILISSMSPLPMLPAEHRHPTGWTLWL